MESFVFRKLEITQAHVRALVLVPTVLCLLSAGSRTGQPVFICWPPSNSEQLVVKCLVQGHLDGTLQKIPVSFNKALCYVEESASVEHGESLLTLL